MRAARGFTLIELMVTVVVVAILAAIALPAYTQYVTDAVNGLSEMRLKMEQYFQDQRRYTGACVADTVAPLPVATERFTFECTPAPDATTYTVLAKGKTGTRMDGFVYSITQANVRSTTAPVSSGWPSCASRWVMKPSDAC